MIRVCEPFLNGNELKYVEDCINANWISSKGSYIDAFEREFAHYCQCKYGITTTSGTTALHLALTAIGLKPGDEVIVPDFTMIATVFAILYTGARPVLVDAEPETWNIDPAKIEAKITERTRAMLPVHIYGHPCDMDSIMAIANRHKLWVVEDAAEAHGAEYNGKKAGSIGHIGCFSFYANKIITTGEGGMVVTNDQAIAKKAQELKDLAHSETRFIHNQVGFNYRMTNVQAAIGMAQLEKIDDLIAARRRHASHYNRLLEKVPGITLPKERPNVKNVYWMYGILIEEEFGMSRRVFIEKLKEQGIETRTFFYPMHDQPVLQDLNITGSAEAFPVSAVLAGKGLYLPSGSGLGEEDLEHICRVISTIKGSVA